MLFPEELALAVTAAAISISKVLPASDTALLGAVFTQLGDTLTTIATARDRLEPTEKADDPNNGGKGGDSGEQNDKSPQSTSK